MLMEVSKKSHYYKLTGQMTTTTVSEYESSFSSSTMNGQGVKLPIGSPGKRISLFVKILIIFIIFIHMMVGKSMAMQ